MCMMEIGALIKTHDDIAPNLFWTSIEISGDKN